MHPSSNVYSEKVQAVVRYEHIEFVRTNNNDNEQKMFRLLHFHQQFQSTVLPLAWPYRIFLVSSIALPLPEVNFNTSLIKTIFNEKLKYQTLDS